MLGITPADGGFFPDVRNVFDQLSASNTATVVLSTVTLIALYVLKKWKPQIPGPLIALAVGIGLVAFTGITERGVATITPVPTGLPIPSLPSMEHIEALIPFALAIALMSYFESVTAARISRQPDDPPLDNNQEYIATGLASIIGSFFQTVPPAGGFSQTQVNSNAGAKTQLSEMVTAVLAIAVALFLAPVLSDLPAATLGAIVIISVLGLISLDEMKRLGSIDTLELVLAAITAFFALAFNLLVGVMVGVFLTLYFALRTLNHPVVVELRRPPEGGELLPGRDGDQPVAGTLVLRIEGGLYTLNVRRVQDEIFRRYEERDPPPEVILLDVGATADTSVTVMDTLLETDQYLERHGSTLWVANIPTRAMEKARRTPLWGHLLEKGKIHATVGAAVTAFEESRRF